MDIKKQFVEKRELQNEFGIDKQNKKKVRRNVTWRKVNERMTILKYLQ